MVFDNSKLELFYSKLNGAIFSNTRHKRFVLWRTWALGKPHILFIGINPSSADETKNDPTINKLISISKYWDYGGLIIMNLIAHISSDPKKLHRSPNFEIENMYLKEFGKVAESVVVIWGNEGTKYMDRVKVIRELFPEVDCFKQNQNGHPLHPLYLANNEWFVKPFDWSKLYDSKSNI